MENPQRKAFNIVLKLNLTFILNIINLPCLLLLLSMNYWAMAQVEISMKNPNFQTLLMDLKSLPSMDLTKLGIVFSDRLHPHMKNVELIVWPFIFLFSRMYRKFCCRVIPPNRDGILFMFRGLT